MIAVIGERDTPIFTGSKTLRWTCSQDGQTFCPLLARYGRQAHGRYRALVSSSGGTQRALSPVTAVGVTRCSSYCPATKVGSGAIVRPVASIIRVIHFDGSL